MAPPAAAASQPVPQMLGFGEPAGAASDAVEPAAPPTEPFVPAIEDFAALAPVAVGPGIALPLEDEAAEPDPSAPDPPSAPSEPAPRAPVMPPRPGPLSAATLSQPTSAQPSRAQQPAASSPVSRPAADPATGAVAPGTVSALDRPGREHLPRNRRLYRRVRLPAEMEIDGVPCSLIDVSVGGFAATGVSALAANATVPVTLRLVIDGIEVGTQLNARIAYANQARTSGRFIELTASQIAFLRYLVTWRGESVGAVGAATLLDAISGGAERAATAGSPGGDAKERWWAGLIGRKVTPPR